MKTTTILAAALTAAALATAAPAQADPSADALAYLQRLNDMGFATYDTAWAVASGYVICDQLNYASGEQVAQDVFSRSSSTDTPTIDWARAWVIAAVDTLCPWQYHPRTTQPNPVFVA
jgi:hypothetical protein